MILTLLLGSIMLISDNQVISVRSTGHIWGDGSGCIYLIGTEQNGALTLSRFCHGELSTTNVAKGNLQIQCIGTDSKNNTVVVARKFETIELDGSNPIKTLIQPRNIEFYKYGMSGVRIGPSSIEISNDFGEKHTIRIVDQIIGRIEYVPKRQTFFCVVRTPKGTGILRYDISSKVPKRSVNFIENKDLRLVSSHIVCTSEGDVYYILSREHRRDSHGFPVDSVLKDGESYLYRWDWSAKLGLPIKRLSLRVDANTSWPTRRIAIMSKSIICVLLNSSKLEVISIGG